MKKEKVTIEVMLQIYCQAHHNTSKELCAQCDALKEYAVKKLDNCVFGKDKPACSKCKVHCYDSDKRDLIVKVMRFSGPKMFKKHPFLAINHIIKILKKT